MSLNDYKSETCWQCSKVVGLPPIRPQAASADCLTQSKFPVSSRGAGTTKSQSSSIGSGGLVSQRVKTFSNPISPSSSSESLRDAEVPPATTPVNTVLTSHVDTSISRDPSPPTPQSKPSQPNSEVNSLYGNTLMAPNPDEAHSRDVSTSVRESAISKGDLLSGLDCNENLKSNSDSEGGVRAESESVASTRPTTSMETFSTALHMKPESIRESRASARDSKHRLSKTSVGRTSTAERSIHGQESSHFESQTSFGSIRKSDCVEAADHNEDSKVVDLGAVVPVAEGRVSEHQLKRPNGDSIFIPRASNARQSIIYATEVALDSRKSSAGAENVEVNVPGTTIEAEQITTLLPDRYQAPLTWEQQSDAIDESLDHNSDVMSKPLAIVINVDKDEISSPSYTVPTDASPSSAQVETPIFIVQDTDEPETSNTSTRVVEDDISGPKELSSSDSIRIQAAKVAAQSQDLCDFYDSLASNPSKKFSLEIVSLIVRSVFDGARRVLELASPIVHVSKLASLLQTIEAEFFADKKSYTSKSETSAADASERGAALRKAVTSTVAAVEALMVEYTAAEKALFVRPSADFLVEAVSQCDITQNGQSYETIDLEHFDGDATWYRRNFAGKEHKNYMGNMDKLGSVIISVKRESLLPLQQLSIASTNSESIDQASCFNRTPSTSTDESQMDGQYRIIMRTMDSQDRRIVVSEADLSHSSVLRGKASTKTIMNFVNPEIQMGKLKKINDRKIEKKLLELDELRFSEKHKVGVLYCTEGQTKEEEFFSNETGSPAFESFLNIIGERIELKGFPGFLGGLDNKNDNTGSETFNAEWRNFEITYHVSTMLPFNKDDPQQIQRKRHIGNDIVCIVFLDGNLTFDPTSIRSQFLHVFIVVREEKLSATPGYKVQIAYSKDVPAFGPPLPSPPVFANKLDLRNFLLAKVINAENAALKAPKFMKPHLRTRHSIFNEIMNEFGEMSTSPRSATDPGSPSLGLFAKDKLRPGSPATLRPASRGHSRRRSSSTDEPPASPRFGSGSEDKLSEKSSSPSRSGSGRLRRVKSTNRVESDKPDKSEKALGSSSNLQDTDSKSHSANNLATDEEDDVLAMEVKSPNVGFRKFSLFGGLRRPSQTPTTPVKISRPVLETEK
ncbi:hypothetical protein HDU76_004341 [Blyttiomyces sp. JEL0837]|nr:hypothetical protein HDU76_004341 [Blyttiomyces sp. JEL0837]